jgi:hypothetical protein
MVRCTAFRFRIVVSRLKSVRFRILSSPCIRFQYTLCGFLPLSCLDRVYGVYGKGRRYSTTPEEEGREEEILRFAIGSTGRALWRY